MRVVRRRLNAAALWLLSGAAGAECIEPTNAKALRALGCEEMERSLDVQTDKDDEWFRRYAACSCHPRFRFEQAKVLRAGGKLEEARQILRTVSPPSAFKNTVASTTGATCGDGSASGVSHTMQAPAWGACEAKRLLKEIEDEIRADEEEREKRKGTISLELDGAPDAQQVHAHLCGAGGASCDDVRMPAAVRRDPGSYRVELPDDLVAEPREFTLVAAGRRIVKVSRRELAPPSKGFSEKQKAEYDAAVRALRSESWVEAREAFERIRSNDEGTLFNIGYAALKNGAHLMAWTHLARAAESKDLAPWLVSRAKQHAAEARQHLSILRVTIPEETKLTVGGRSLKPSGVPGHWLEAESGGSPPPSSFLLVLDRGARRYTFEAYHRVKGRKVWTQVIDVESGAIRIQVSEPPPPPPRPVPVAGWALLGGGAALLATGAAFAVAGQNKRADAEALCPNDRCGTSEGWDAVESGQTLMIASAVFVGLGAFGAAFGAPMVFSRKKEAPAAPSWDFELTSDTRTGSWSLVTSGRF